MNSIQYRSMINKLISKKNTCSYTVTTSESYIDATFFELLRKSDFKMTKL